MQNRLGHPETVIAAASRPPVPLQLALVTPAPASDREGVPYYHENGLAVIRISREIPLRGVQEEPSAAVSGRADVEVGYVGEVAFLEGSGDPGGAVGAGSGGGRTGHVQ